jgi:hypothetical protein
MHFFKDKFVRFVSQKWSLRRAHTIAELELRVRAARRNNARLGLSSIQFFYWRRRRRAKEK